EHVLGRDVAQVALAAEAVQQPNLLLAAGRLEDQPVRVDRVHDLVDQAGTHLSVGAIDAGRTRLSRLGDHLPGAGLQVAFDLLHPDIGGHDEVRILAADLREHREVACKRADQVSLDLRVQGDRAVGDLHVAQTELAQPRDQTLHATLLDRDLGERPAEHHRDPVRGIALKLGLQVRGHERRAPAELDDVHAVAHRLDQAVHLGYRQTTVAGPASWAIVGSIGCTWVTLSAFATARASARCPCAYWTTVVAWVPGGTPVEADARV